MLRTGGSACWLVVNDDGAISLLGEKRPELIDQSAAHKGTKGTRQNRSILHAKADVKSQCFSRKTLRWGGCFDDFPESRLCHPFSRNGGRMRKIIGKSATSCVRFFS
jgi:hypothetical protein